VNRSATASYSSLAVAGRLKVASLIAKKEQETACYKVASENSCPVSAQSWSDFNRDDLRKKHKPYRLASITERQGLEARLGLNLSSPMRFHRLAHFQRALL
jgi:hypothetical protein